MTQQENVQQANFSVRLDQRMNELGLSQHALASQLKTSQSTVRGWLNGAMPRERIMSDLASCLNVNAHWLKTGEDKQSSEEEESPRHTKAREMPTHYKFIPRGSSPQFTKSADLQAACIAMLTAMTNAGSSEVFDYAVAAFEENWDKFKAAKHAELNQLKP